MSYPESVSATIYEPLATPPIRVGVIGTGFGASLHLSALRENPDFETAAICSRRPDRARAAALDHGIPAHFADYRELVRDERVEAVIIASPPHLHHPMAIAALEQGKHVLCEKPMARNLAEARDMQRIADRVGTVAMVNLQLRFLPVRVRIAELIGEGYIGEPHAASVVVHRSSLNDPHDRPWGWLMEQEKAGGMLGATGAHYLDALRWWFGDVKAVDGRRVDDGSAAAAARCLGHGQGRCRRQLCGDPPLRQWRPGDDPRHGHRRPRGRRRDHALRLRGDACRSAMGGCGAPARAISA